MVQRAPSLEMLLHLTICTAPYAWHHMHGIAATSALNTTEGAAEGVKETYAVSNVQLGLICFDSREYLP